MGKFVGRDHSEHRQIRQNQRAEGIEAPKISPYFRPVCHCNTGRKKNSQRGQPNKGGCEEELQLGHKPVEQAVRIERLEPEIKDIAPNPAVRVGPIERALFLVQETKPPQPIDELLQRFRRKRSVEPFFDSLPHRLGRGHAVQLLGDEVLSFSKAKEAFFGGIFDDEDALFRCALAADHQITSQFDWRG